jgi:sec-independent protein translocase protein TatB
VFNLSGSEIVVILLLALVVLGPEKLPDAIRRAGRTYSELKKMGNSFQAEMKSVLDEPMKEMRETADLLKKSMDFTDGELTGTKAPSRSTTAVRSAATPAPVDATTTGDPTSDDATVNGGTTDRAAAADAATPPPGVATPSEPAADAPAPGPGPGPDDELINRTLSGDR